MNIDINQYSHVSFDLWLTLIKSDSLYKKKKNELLKDYFSINYKKEHIEDTTRYYDLLCNKINEKTGLHMEREEIYYLILNRLDVDISKITKENIYNFYKEADDLLMQHKPVLIYPDIEKTLKKITNTGKTISILSNTAFIYGNALRKILAYYELSDYFSFQLYSDETGFSKPNSKLFDLVFESVYKLRPISRKEIIHIGDNETADMQGAIQAGFQAILLKS